MIYTDDFIFVHVPKTAGQAVRHVLGVNPNRFMHTKLKEVDSTDRFSFGFVRNPWERMLSAYLYILDNNVDAPVFIRDGFKKSLLEEKLYLWGKYYLQEDAMEWLQGCDFIGRFEQLEYDLESVCRAIGVTYRKPPIIDATDHVHYSHYYDQEMIEFVAEQHKQTIDRFGYTFTDNS